MRFAEQSVVGSYLVSLEPIEDERGFFARAFSTDEFDERGMEPHIAQMNLARSVAVGTTRGIHWQLAPHSEARFVRCIRGAVFDVCVDMRPESDTYLQWVGAELTAENHMALYLPPGCGHGYQTLAPDTELLYSASAPYEPASERGARWDDPALGVTWPITDAVVLSQKDTGWPDLSR